MRIRVLLFLCLIGARAFGQSFELREMAQSPNASTLGQYGEIPVSQFTGVPRIEIPIYEFSVDSHKFPIFINYHTSGIRVEQKPSWIGAGWNLLAGGSIIRKQNGGADEEKNEDGSGHEAGYFHHYSDLNQPNWGTTNFINSFMDSKTGEQLINENDYDADEFQFNFLGYSGSFFMNHTGAWQVRCDKPIRVDEMILGQINFTLSEDTENIHTKVIKGFVIITDDGTRYRFGYDDDAIDYSIPFYNQTKKFWTSSAWHLTKITYPSGATVRLHYTRGHFTCQIWHDYSQRGGKFSDENSTFGKNYYNPNEYYGALISPSYLTSVSIPQGNITFYSSDMLQLEHSFNVSTNPYQHLYYYLVRGLHHEYNSQHPAPIQSRVLDSIVVKNTNNLIIKKANFNYFPESNKKLGLSSIELYGSGNENPERYTFDYYHRNSLPESYDIRWTDHWGYYIGSRWAINSVLSESRNPVEALAGYGVLNRITYPTGGYTRFEYEPHKCSFVLNSTKTGIQSNYRLVGGCRIKRVINSPTGHANDEIIAKEYYYVKNFQNYVVDPPISTSGVLAGLPQYDVTGYVLTCPKKSSLSCSLNLYNMNHSVYSGGMNSLGSHIGYTEVAERYPNGSFRIYKFSNYDNGYLDNAATALYDGTRREFVKFSSMEQMRGLLLRIDEYKADKTLVKSQEFSYRMDTTQFVRGFYINVLHYKQNGNHFYPILEACTYKHYTDVPRLEEQRETVYANGVTHHRYQKFEYNQYGQIARSVEDRNQGDSIETIYTYIWEMPGFNQSDFLRSPIFAIERNIYRNLGFWDDWLYQRNCYTRQSENLYVPSRIYKSYFTPDHSSPMVDSIICDYDSLGHLIYQAKHNGTEHTVYLWHYTGQYVIGIIKNASVEQVMSVLNCDKDFLGCMPEDSEYFMVRLRQELPESLVTSYQYMPLVGMVSETSPAGITKYYEYDNGGRLKGIKNEHGEYIEFYKYNITH